MNLEYNIEEGMKLVDFKEFAINYSDWYNIFSVIHIRERIATIDGIKIYIYPNEYRSQHKLPHLHARYNDKEVVARIDTGDFIRGNIDKNKHKILKKWINEHQNLIKEKWDELNKGIFIPVI